MQTQTILEVLRFIPLLFILSYAAYSDHKTSYASNKLWLYAPIGLASTVLTLFLYPQLTTLTIISTIATTTLSLILFYVGAWGGADAKALITIALATPLTPIWGTPITILPLIVIAIAGPIAITYTISKHPKNLLKAKVRYLPFLLAGYIITILIF